MKVKELKNQCYHLQSGAANNGAIDQFFGDYAKNQLLEFEAFFNEEQETILDSTIKVFPGGLKEGYDPNHYENLPPYYFPKEKIMKMRELEKQMPRLD